MYFYLFNLLEKIKIETQLFKRQQNGVTAVEYGLIAVAVTLLVVMVLFYNDGAVINAYAEKFKQLTELIQGALNKA